MWPIPRTACVPVLFFDLKTIATVNAKRMPRIAMDMRLSPSAGFMDYGIDYKGGSTWPPESVVPAIYCFTKAMPRYIRERFAARCVRAFPVDMAPLIAVGFFVRSETCQDYSSVSNGAKTVLIMVT
jgi:hypothetical protein